MTGSGNLVKTIEIKDRQGRIIATEDVVTYAGLLSLAHDQGLKKIETTLVQMPDQLNGQTAVFLAVIETEKGSFKGYGDANPDNVTARIIPHIIRMAETRAKARALRDAVNIGVVALEELSTEGNGRTVGPSSINPTGASVEVSSGDVAAKQKSSSAAVDSAGEQEPITDAQRRFLFRLLAERRIEGEDARRYLLEKSAATSLDEITKAQASGMIEELLGTGKRPQEVPF